MAGEMAGLGEGEGRDFSEVENEVRYFRIAQIILAGKMMF